MEGKLLVYLQKTLEYNTEEKGHLIDDFIAKYTTLVGAICSDTPTNIPILI